MHLSCFLLFCFATDLLAHTFSSIVSQCLSESCGGSHLSRSIFSNSAKRYCEGKILAYKENKLCHISILYIKNISEEYFLGI